MNKILSFAEHFVLITIMSCIFAAILIYGFVTTVLRFTPAILAAYVFATHSPTVASIATIILCIIAQMTIHHFRLHEKVNSATDPA